MREQASAQVALPAASKGCSPCVWCCSLPGACCSSCVIMSQAIFDASLLATALDCLEHLCKHRTSLLAARTASFVRRLLQMALVAPHGHAVALLCAISNAAQSHTRRTGL